MLEFGGLQKGYEIIAKMLANKSTKKMPKTERPEWIRRIVLILKIPIICIRLLIVIVPWILIVGIILNVIDLGIMKLLSNFGFPNWKFYIGEDVWHVREAVAIFGAIAGTILLFMGYRHLKLLFSVDRDKLIYDLEEKFNLLRKLEQLKEKKPIEPLKEHSLDCMISDLTEVLKQEKEKRGKKGDDLK